MNLPKISIITVVYNAAKTIEETVLSVIQQAYSNIEYVIIDGKSTDGTVAILEQYQSHFGYFISESDKGLYDAMNKGMKQCSGDFCLFLNAGDVLYESTTIEQIIVEIDDLYKVYFSTAVLTDRKSMYRLIPPEKVEIEEWLKDRLPNHQTMLFPRAFYTQNEYDLSYRISADDDFKLRALRQYSSKFIPIWSVIFEMGGLSSSYASFKVVQQRINELYRLYDFYYPDQKMVIHKFALKSYFIFLMSRFWSEDKLIRRFNKFDVIPKGEEERFQPFTNKKAAQNQ
ncbi:MAG: glycosyltransferase family 2 protein [Bacteroidota bacterium]